MNNTYYYIFYLLVKFARKINPRDSDPAFTVILWLSIPIGLNILSAIIYFGKIGLHQSKATLILYVLIAFGPLVLINYLLFVSNKKGVEIVEYFDIQANAKKHRRITFFFFVIYFIGSLGLCFYLGLLNRKLMGL